MRYIEFLTLLIEDGIEAARLQYTKPGSALKLQGALTGFEECRNLAPDKLSVLLDTARAVTTQKLHDQAPDYWYWRCRDAEIEWVCNVVSAMLINEGQTPIRNCACTVRGMLKAAEIVGERSLTPPRGH